MAFRSWLTRQRGDGSLERAGELVDKAVRLSDAGRHDDAVRVSQQAVDSLIEVAERDRSEAVVYLALAYRNLSEHLFEAGRVAEALARAEDAVRSARQLYAMDRRSEQILAIALAVLTKRLVDCGQPAQALSPAREALELSDAPSDELLSRLLNPYANALAATGQYAEAAQVSGQNVELTRMLAVDQPVGSRPYEAMGWALRLHASQLYRVGQWREAVEVCAEAVAYFRELASLRVPARRDLAFALKNLSVLLWYAQRRTEALEAAEEAVEICRGLFASEPAAYQPALASCLETYSARLADLDRVEDAVAAAEESVRLYRELASVDPGAYLEHLASAIGALGAATDEPNASLARSTEAVEIRRKLVAANRPGQLRGLALSLSNMAKNLTLCGRIDEAVERGEEALQLERECAATNRPAMLSRHADTLRVQAHRLDEAGRAEAALKLGFEAVQVAREAVTANRGANLRTLAGALEEQAARIDRSRSRNGASQGQRQSRRRRKDNGQAAYAMAREARTLRAEIQS